MSKNITLETYFNNNNKGFDSPYLVNFPELNIMVEVYYNRLKKNKIDKIEFNIKETVKYFQNLSNLEQNDSEKNLKIYIFDDLDDYRHYGNEFNLGLGNEGGMAYYRGGKGKNAFVDMYVYRAGGIHNLKHELAHGLTYVATEGKQLPSLLMEGIADYLEHLSNQNFNTREGFSIDKTENIENLSLNNILELGSSKNAEDRNSVYKVGHALIMYLQAIDSNIMKEYLKAIREKHFISAIQTLESNYDPGKFKTWLSQNDTKTAMKEINALQVTKGEFIATKRDIIDGEIKNVSYYKANIETMNGENVGKFSTIAHYAVGNTLRVENKATHDLLDLSNKYNFMKVVNYNDEVKLVYSDKHGNNYQNSREYINQVATIAAKYDENIKGILKNLDDIENEKSDMLNEYQNVINQYRDNKVKLVTVNNAYEKYKQTEIEHRQQKIKFEHMKEIVVENLSGQIKSITNDLTYFDPSHVRCINNESPANFEHGKIYSLRSNGASAAKQMNGISIYDRDNKKGELLTDCGYFANVENILNQNVFYFVDNLMNLYSKFDNFVYVAVTKENGEFTTSLIDGRSVIKDEYYDKPHIHRNELLKPSINHINKVDDSLLLKKIKILDHSESEVAKVRTRIKKGKLLDDKGTIRLNDDVYEAKIEDDFMYTFQNRGFYIHTKGDFFIHDHGKNVRYQLPKAITHLKLVEKDGVKKLVPVTKDGNDNPHGMPSDIQDKYKYIDLIFAHKYEKKDHSQKHVNIGLINFDNYKLGAMFSMQYDPNDYQIPKDKDGNVVQLNNQSYFTKVKLFDTHGEEIGMLSNNFHNYMGKFFFSVDYNYSYVDFFTSAYPQVNIEQLTDGDKVITFNQGKGDIVDTDRGYTNHERIYVKTQNQDDSSSDIKQNDQPISEQIKSNNSCSDYTKVNLQSESRVKEKIMDINARDNNGQTRLHNAIISENTDEAKFLIDDGASVNIQDEYYRLNEKFVYYKTPLHYAVESENLELIQYLLNHDANPNIENAYGRTPLYEAVCLGNLEIIQSLLDHDADVNFEGKYVYNKPLIVVAVESGDVEVIKLLSQKGVDLNVRNTSAQTSLHYAIELGHTEIAKFLIDHDAGNNTRDINSGKPPLHFAMSKKNMEIVKYLVDHTRNIDIRDSYGLTPLHFAVELGNQEMVKYLINSNANINLKDSSGWTPLASAARYGLIDIVEYLVSHDANVHIKCNGLTLLQCAEDGINANSLAIADYNQKYQDRQELLDKIKFWEKIKTENKNSHDNQLK